MSLQFVFSGSGATNASASSGINHKNQTFVYELSGAAGQSGSISWTARLESSPSTFYTPVLATEVRTGLTNVTASVSGTYRIDGTGLEVRPVVTATNGLVLAVHISTS